MCGQFLRLSISTEQKALLQNAKNALWHRPAADDAGCIADILWQNDRPVKLYFWYPRAQKNVKEITQYARALQRIYLTWQPTMKAWL